MDNCACNSCSGYRIAVVLLLLHGLTEEEIKKFPKGTLIVRVAKKLHLLK